jgi:hypothetical protein
VGVVQASALQDARKSKDLKTFLKAWKAEVLKMVSNPTGGVPGLGFQGPKGSPASLLGASRGRRLQGPWGVRLAPTGICRPAACRWARSALCAGTRLGLAVFYNTTAAVAASIYTSLWTPDGARPLRRAWARPPPPPRVLARRLPGTQCSGRPPAAGPDPLFPRPRRCSPLFASAAGLLTSFCFNNVRLANSEYIFSNDTAIAVPANRSWVQGWACTGKDGNLTR